jgi:16S rRNA (adenine1518-N6/adenine1519-N6)-dimethyltransferase
MLQTLFDATLLFDVDPAAFRPRPKVTSTYLRLVPHQRSIEQINDLHQFSMLVTSAFSQRRKTLRNSLRSLLDADQINAAGIDASRRAETLSLEEFIALGNMLESGHTDR